MDPDRDWTTLSNQEAVKIIRTAAECSSDASDDEAWRRMDSTYMMTTDNLLKMMSILMRLRCRLPVLIMGETGCGKTSLLTQLMAVLGARLFTLNVHGGYMEADVIRWMEEVLGQWDALGPEEQKKQGTVGDIGYEIRDTAYSVQHTAYRIHYHSLHHTPYTTIHTITCTP
jgi:hypothetical protein